MQKASSKFIDSRRQESKAVPSEHISSEELHEDGQISTEITSSTTATQQPQEQDTTLPSELSTLASVSSEQKLSTEESSKINDYQPKVLESTGELSNDSKNDNIFSNWEFPQQEQVRLHRSKKEKGKNVLKQENIYKNPNSGKT